MLSTTDLDKRGIKWRQSRWSFERHNYELETCAFTDNGSYEKMYFVDYCELMAEKLTEEENKIFIVVKGEATEEFNQTVTVVEILGQVNQEELN